MTIPIQLVTCNTLSFTLLYKKYIGQHSMNNSVTMTKPGVQANGMHFFSSSMTICCNCFRRLERLQGMPCFDIVPCFILKLCMIPILFNNNMIMIWINTMNWFHLCSMVAEECWQTAHKDPESQFCLCRQLVSQLGFMNWDKRYVFISLVEIWVLCIKYDPKKQSIMTWWVKKRAIF